MSPDFPNNLMYAQNVSLLLLNVFIVDLVGLLRWRSQKRQIPSVLTSLLKIDGEEIVKVSEFIIDCAKEVLAIPKNRTNL